MAKRIHLEPGWLVSLLNQWALHDMRSQTGGLGFASGSNWMRGLKSSPASSIDPTGYAARDFRDINAAMEALMADGTNLWAAVMMYYKPWCVAAFKAEGYPHQTTVFYDRLRRAHLALAAMLDRQMSQKGTCTE
jgi:hypothetical protein